MYTSQWAEFEFKTSVVIGTDCVGSCKSNYHTITATTKRIANCHRSVLCIHYNDFMDFWNLKNNLADHHSLEQTHDGINIYMYNYSTNTSTTTDWKFTYNTSHSWFKHMVFNATFNIISAISWRSVLLVEETGQTLSLYNVVLSTHRHEQDSNSQF